MHKLEQHIEAHWGHLKSNPAVVACSGGLDSTVLLYVLHKLKFDVRCMHVNYHLRGDDSDKDAAFVQAFCTERKIPVEIRSESISERLENGGNLQQIAREIRYDWFFEIKKENPKSNVFLAHHQNDQVETFFLNLARKSGVMGLACMPEERDRIVRPLLTFSKDELKEYTLSENISWREDVSNASNKYRRNLLRNEILPFLETELPSINESVLLLIAHFQQKQRELEEKITPIVEEVKETKAISIDRINTLDDFELVEFMRQFGQPHQKATELRTICQAQKGKKVDFISDPTQFFQSIVKEDKMVSFIPLNQKKANFSLTIEQVNELPSTFSKNEIYLDAQKISGQLVLREWKIGDRMHPIGMKGSKLISEIIADARITADAKNDIHVLHDDEDIHWCVGLKIGRKAIATVDSKKKVKVRVLG